MAKYAAEHYGVPLKSSLKGYWKLRVGDYRVVFKITTSEVRILTILHRETLAAQTGISALTGR